jgi:hypothetical protein
MEKELTMTGNIDNNYVFKKGEENHYHVRVNDRVHLTDAQEYKDNFMVIKYTRHNFLMAEKHGGFKKFKNVKVLHDPTLASKNDVAPLPNDSDPTLAEDYKLVFLEDAPEGMSDEEIKSAITDKSKEIKDSVRESYEMTLNAKPGNKGVVTMLREIETAQ